MGYIDKVVKRSDKIDVNDIIGLKIMEFSNKLDEQLLKLIEDNKEVIKDQETFNKILISTLMTFFSNNLSNFAINFIPAKNISDFIDEIIKDIPILCKKIVTSNITGSDII